MNGTRRVRTAGDVARGVGALLLLAALLAGIPALLLTVVGLPSGLPSADVLRGYLSRPDDGTVFIAAASAIAWAGWAVFAASIAVEAAGAARGRRWQLPGLSGVQRPAAHLVSAVVVLLAGTATPTLGGFPARPAAAAPYTPPDPAPKAPPVSSTAAATDHAATAPATRPTAAASGREIVVAPRDTLWALAERHSGDPLGWRALAKANYGRPQPDGRRLTDAHWIYPGWRLQLPASWTSSAPSRPTAPGQSGDEGPPRSQPHPPPGDPVPTSQAQAPPSASASANPATRPSTRPGGQAPATASAPAPSATRPADLPAVPVTTTPAGTDSGEAAWAVGLAGSGLLAAGLLLELRRHRRRQQRHRGSGQRIPLPSLEGAETESALHRAADPAAANSLRLVLRRLAEQAPAAAAAVRAAELGSTQLRLWLAGDQPPPAPWLPGPDPGTWTLDAAGRRKVLADAVPAATPDPLPGLVTVGRTVDGGYLLWNLEAAVVTTVAGPPSVTTAWLRTASLELATSSWSGGGWFELAVVGLDLPDLDRISRYPSLAAAIDAVEHRAAETREAMTGLDPQTPPAARLARPDDDRLAPTLLVTAEAPTAGELARLQAATGVGTLALVAAAPAESGAVLTLDVGGAATIPQLGLSVAAQALTADEIDAVSALFATAAAPPVPAGTGRYAELTGGDLLAERQLVPADARPAPGRRADQATTKAPRPRRLGAVAPTVPPPAAPAALDVTQAAEPAPAGRVGPQPLRRRRMGRRRGKAGSRCASSARWPSAGRPRRSPAAPWNSR